MCQLTVSNLLNATLNQLYMVTALRLNAEKNPHGTGVFCGGRVFKSGIPAYNIHNLGEILTAHVLDESPVLGHVRLASKGTEISEANVHPFVTEDFVLMHNGTLTPKNGELPAGSSDSEAFAKELQKVYKAEKDVVKALNIAYKSFTGKFAFLIYDKSTRQTYVCRGKTATLFAIKVNNGGYIINTDKEDLISALWGFSQIAQILHYEVSYGETIHELKENTIYRLERESITEIGQLVEVATPISYGHHSHITHIPTVSGSITKIEDDYEKIAKWCEYNFVGLAELDWLMYQFTGATISDVQSDDIEFFVEHVVKKMGFSKNLYRKLSKITTYVIKSTYEEHGLAFPLCLNSLKDVKAALNAQAGKL